MRDTIAWSYDLLPPEEQVLFQTLSIFVGGCTLEAAEVVCTSISALDVVDGITHLIDHSLLRQEASRTNEPRFSMLETVREFGLEQLAASGDEAAIQQAHAAWCLALAETEESWTWGGSRQRWWLDRLEVDLPNLRAALAWLAENGDAETGARLAAALWGYWHLRSHRAEGRAWLERALVHGISSDRTRAKALLVLGQLYHLTGTQRVTDLLEEAWPSADVWTTSRARLLPSSCRGLRHAIGVTLPARPRFSAKRGSSR